MGMMERYKQLWGMMLTTFGKRELSKRELKHVERKEKEKAPIRGLERINDNYFLKILYPSNM